MNQVIENKILNRFQILSRIDFNLIKVINKKNKMRLLKKLKTCHQITLIESQVNEKLPNNLQIVTNLHPHTNRLSQANNHKRMTMSKNLLSNQTLWVNENSHQAVLHQISLKRKVNQVLQSQARKCMNLKLSNLKVKMLSLVKIQVLD